MAVCQEMPDHGSVIDIGGSAMHNKVEDKLIQCLLSIGDLNGTQESSSSPTLPDELLYNNRGLKIWNWIISGPEFYQTHDEIALFDKFGSDIVRQVEPGVTIIDLGAGDTRKVGHLLQAFEDAGVQATYLALDISRASLQHNIGYLAARHYGSDSKVTCAGLWGTFEDGLRYVEKISGPRLFLSLGSVLCNDAFTTALGHLQQWASKLKPDDLLLIGMDAHLAPEHEDKIWAAYHSRPDLYQKFFMNGFDHANRLMKKSWFHEKDWDFLAQLETEPTTRHRFFFKAKTDVGIPSLGRVIPAGVELDWFDSHKWGEKDVLAMCHKAGLRKVQVWQAPGSEFRQYLVQAKDGRNDLDGALLACDT